MNISIPNCLTLQNIAYDNFWDTIKKITTPIIEPLENDHSFCKVTFLYRAKEDTKHVVLGTYGLISYDPKYDQLHRIPNTDIFYRTYLFPQDLKTIYCLSPNDALLSVAETDLYDCDLSPMVKTWQSDPFNPQQYTLPGWLILGEEEKQFSLLKLPEAKDSPWAQKQEHVIAGEITSHIVEGTFIQSSRTIQIYKPHQPAGTDQIRPNNFTICVINPAG